MKPAIERGLRGLVFVVFCVLMTRGQTASPETRTGQIPPDSRASRLPKSPAVPSGPVRVSSAPRNVQIPSNSLPPRQVASELELVAAVLCGEARGEGRQGMEAVWEVICERRRKAGENQTLASVLTRPAHFSCLNRTTPAALIVRMKQESQWALALQIASQPPHTRHAHNADHYAIMGKLPYWAVGHRPVARVGRHCFCRLSPA